MLRPVLVVIGLFVMIFGVGYVAFNDSSDGSTGDAIATESVDREAEQRELPSTLQRAGLNVDYSQASIPLDQILAGGPVKDGIPAITDPGFTQLNDARDIADDVQVMYVEHAGEEKLYPYNILVWHEIVNDSVGGKPLAITFCPLCGSAIVFEREIDGEVIDFGVSGLLYESNLLMYSREQNETLWSQARGEAVVGNRLGAELEHYPTQLFTFGEAKDRFPNAVIMDTNTGFSRDYTSTPYSGYEDTEDLVFDVSVEDKRFPAKEIFYVIPLEGASIAVRNDKNDGVYDVPDTDIKVTFENGIVTARWGDAVLPGYFEMWFSWATHHQVGGIVVD